MKKPDNEPRIAVQLMIRASLLGPLVVFLDNRADEFGSQIVKEVGAGKNLPRGAFNETLFELIAKGGMPIGDVKSFMRKAGFTTSTVHTNIGKMIRDKKLIKNRNGVIRKGKK